MRVEGWAQGPPGAQNPAPRASEAQTARIGSPWNGPRSSAGQVLVNCGLGGDLGPEPVPGQPGWGGRGRRVNPDWCFTSFADAAPKGAAGEGPPAAEKDPGPPDPQKDPGPPDPEKDAGPPNPEKELGPPDPKKEPDPLNSTKDTEAPAPEKGDGASAQASTTSQGPEGEGGLQGEPAEGSAGQLAALPQETATTKADVKKPEAEQKTPGSQDPGEGNLHKKVAEGQAASKKGAPAFLHSPSCPAAISR